MRIRPFQSRFLSPIHFRINKNEQIWVIKNGKTLQNQAQNGTFHQTILVANNIQELIDYVGMDHKRWR